MAIATYEFQLIGQRHQLLVITAKQVTVYAAHFIGKTFGLGGAEGWNELVKMERELEVKFKIRLRLKHRRVRFYPSAKFRPALQF